MKAGIVVFPGSNCDRDVHHILNNVIGISAQYVWHTEKTIDVDRRSAPCPRLPGPARASSVASIAGP